MVLESNSDELSESLYEKHDSCKEEDEGSFDTKNMNNEGEEQPPTPNLKDFESEFVMKLTFDNINEVEHFIKSYSKEVGFDIRRYSSKTKDGELRNRVWVCAREGFRPKPAQSFVPLREPRRETRCGCKASFRVALDRFTRKYNVTTFEARHNHELVKNENKHLLRCNRQLSAADKAWLSTLTMAGIKPSQVMDLMEQMRGGIGSLPFKRKDGYNYLNGQRLKMVEGGDVNTGMNILEGMKIHDKDLIFKYTTAEDGSLTKLFWCDGLSRAEYTLFGDVVAFDSTYKTNKYLFPLVIFSGINNHFSTCVFGAALMYNETIDSYRWLLKTFRESMNGKIPSAVLTDQDQSMRAAIRMEFPGARHRLCAWHILRNARQNVQIPKFVNELGGLTSTHLSVDEFEESWVRITETYGVSNHDWVLKTYENRRLWSEAFFRGQFTGMMRTTQRSESMNSLIKLCVKQSFTLTEFLIHYHHKLKRIRSTFVEKQDIEETKPKPIREGPLKRFEEHAAIKYTQKLFYLVRAEICAEQDLVVEKNECVSEGKHVMTFSEYNNPNARSISVSIDVVKSKFLCECMMLESDGIPCRHIISVLKSLRYTAFPDTLLKPRWLISTGTDLQSPFRTSKTPVDPKRKRMATMNKQWTNLTFLSSQSDNVFTKSLNRVKKIAKMAEDDMAMQSQVGETNDTIEEKNHDLGAKHNIRDPAKIKARGAPKSKAQNCGICGKPGHKATTCQLNPAMGQHRQSEDPNKKRKCQRNFDRPIDINRVGVNPNASIPINTRVPATWSSFCPKNPRPPAPRSICEDLE